MVDDCSKGKQLTQRLTAAHVTRRNSGQYSNTMLCFLFQRLTWSNALQGEVRVGSSTLYRPASQLISDSCFETSFSNK